jgi:nucleotide-binding universal stress UspA family protein
MYKKILNSTDGSKFGSKAVTHGVNLAKSDGSSVIILTTTEMWSGIDMAKKASQGTVNPVSAYEDAAGNRAKKILSAAEAIATQAGVKVECIHVKDKHPAEAIISTAVAKKCNLIVMGSHGRRGIEKVLMGSVATEVITRSSLPVLVVK